MIPQRLSVLNEDWETVRQPSCDFCIDFENGRIGGLIRDREAAQQAVRLRLMTERGAYPIYSDGYGLDRARLARLSAPLLYVCVKNDICDTLSEDDRVLQVGDFAFGSDGGGSLSARFVVRTEFGDTKGETAI